MKTTNSFSMSRIGLLTKLYLTYNRKLISTSLFGLAGGLVVLFFTIQTITGFDSWHYEHFFFLFMGLFIVLAIAFSGTSFPGLRTKEKSINYLLVPATTLEKFVFELFSRVVFFFLLLPTLYWTVFHLEGNLAQLLNPEFDFQSFAFFEGVHLQTESLTGWYKTLIPSVGLLFLTVPFFGATVYMKYPIIKTLLWVVALLILISIMYVIFGMPFQGHEINIVFLTLSTILISIVLVGMSFIKLKSKEV